VSETGPRRLSRGTSGGPTSHALSASEGQGGWDSSVEGVSDLESGSLGGRRRKGPRLFLAALVRADAIRGERQEASLARPFGLHEADKFSW